jgi:streptogramin lyase
MYRKGLPWSAMVRRHGKRIQKSGGPSLTGLGLVLVAALALASPAGAAQKAPVQGGATATQFVLSAQSFVAFGGIAEGPDGNMWQLVTKGQPGKTAGEQRFTSAIDRITPSGQITEFPLPPLPPDQYLPKSLTSGPEASMWYSAGRRIGRVTMSGQVTEFPIVSSGNGDIVAGPDGNLWLTDPNGGAVTINGFPTPVDAIVRVTTTGQETRFPLPEGSDPSGISLGPDGNLWFTESFQPRIGRITPAGAITEFPLSPDIGGAEDIVAGRDGALWFVGRKRVGRITTDGQVSEYPPKVPDYYPIAIAAGADGRLWFPGSLGVIGRIAPNGRVSTVALPFPEGQVGSVAAGPAGTVWYSQSGERPCEGGGGSCQATPLKGHGIVGKIEPGPLEVEIGGVRSVASLHLLKIRLICRGGQAGQTCRGALLLKRHGIRLTKRRFVVTGDGERGVLAKIGPRARRILDRSRPLNVTAVVTLAGGETQRSSVRLPPAKRR